MDAPVLSVVVPVHDEDAVLPELRERLAAAMAGAGVTWEAIYVDDGSTDGSATLIEGWLGDDADDVTLVSLSRNFGMEVAMSAGLDHARGERVALMHADLQDPPELIPEMLRLADEHGADVVYARRIGRDESRLKRSLATGFYTLMERLARVPYQGQAGDFRLMSRRVVEAVRAMPERRRFLRGMVAWTGFKQMPIEYRRAGRLAGRGASYPELFRLAFEALAAFSDVPLAVAAYLGLFTAATSAVGAILLVVLWLAQAIDPTPMVWALAAVLFLGGVQLIGLGIIGRYLARVHEEALRRPLYVLDSVRSSRRGR
jgi:glycosyltransferase involved in cell wall biosynthesis